MNNERIEINDMVPLQVRVTKDVAIFRQLGMWTDLKKTYTLVPSGKRGFVLVVRPDNEGRYQLVQGYTLYRPCGLELTWHTDRIVVFHELTMVDGVKAQLGACKDTWQIIGNDHNAENDIPF